MFELKPLSADAIPEALERVERYRLLNEPRCAESICRDVLCIDPNNKQALIQLILSLTDQFGESLKPFAEAAETAARLDNEYPRAYYSGIVRERRAHAHLHRATPGSGSIVYDMLLEAMEYYDEAEKLQPVGNDDAILRWNTCARVIMDHDNIKPAEDIATPIQLE